MRTLLTALTMATVAVAAYPCSRVVLRGDSTEVVQVGRTLDWRTPIPTNLYVYPAGMAKQSYDQPGSLTWTSQFGSVLAVGYDGGVTEGMNDHGLVMNGLFCKQSRYRMAAKGEDIPTMSLSVLVSYFLDNFEYVADVAEWLRGHDFAIAGETFDGGTASLLHWALTDRTGNTLIMEYDNGKLNLYESPAYQVLTNDPSFPQMQAVNNYWESVGGQNFLPGGVRSTDRYARAWYFVHHVPVTGITPDQGLTELMTIIDNVAVPYGYEVPGAPNLSSTQWRSVADLNRMRYYFKFADQRSAWFIDLSTLDLTPGAPVLKLDTTGHPDLSGCVNRSLRRSAPFSPMW